MTMTCLLMPKMLSSYISPTNRNTSWFKPLFFHSNHISSYRFDDHAYRSLLFFILLLRPLMLLVGLPNPWLLLVCATVCWFNCLMPSVFPILFPSSWTLTPLEVVVVKPMRKSPKLWKQISIFAQVLFLSLEWTLWFFVCLVFPDCYVLHSSFVSLYLLFLTLTFLFSILSFLSIPIIGALIRDLNLRRPVLKKTAAYGHFGRNDPDFTWETPKPLKY